MAYLGTRSKMAAVVALFGVTALTAACAGNAGQASTSTDAPSVEFGASIEDYQTALADIDPIQLRMQTGATGPDSSTGQTFTRFADQVEEWSGGKITIEVNWVGTIAELTEVDSALEDGRLDLAQFSPTYKPKEYPVSTNMVDASVRGFTSPLNGELAQQLAMAQASNGTDAVFKEYAPKGLTPLVPISAGGALGMACNSEVSNVDNLKGRQILAHTPIQIEQIEALGGTNTFVEYTEMYEALQRGILDCALAPMSLFNSMGLAEVAPNYYFPEGTTFQLGPTAFVAGSSWDTLPLPAQQLIFDSSYRWLQMTNHAIYRNTEETVDVLAEKGMAVQQFDSSISKALEEANESIADEQAASDAYDAQDFADRYTESLQHWSDTADGLGYSDAGDYTNFSDWFEGNLESEDGEFLDEIYAEAFAEVASERRPE